MDSKDMAEAKQDVNSAPSGSSRLVLARPRLGRFGASSFASAESSSNSFGSVLRPPQLKTNANPFAKAPTDSDEDKTTTGPPKDEAMKDDVEAPKFMPLGSTSATARTSNPVPTPAQPGANSGGFVFGQNLSERVMINETKSNGDVEPVNHSSSNGASELLFTTAAATVNNQETAESSAESSEGLAAAAAAYERCHARPPPPEQHVTRTGEEEEINVLQISCRLFAWESGSWRERGRGVLRLNDAAGGGGARLVARVAGSLRVVLNTKLWPAMVVERAGAKSLRITAADAQQQIKLFLIMGAPADISLLHKSLLSRVAGSKQSSTCTQDASSQEAAVRLDSDYQEKPENSDNDQNETDRLQETESNVDDVENKEESKTLKRKEPLDDDESPKRQCPKTVVE